ncbi:LysE family transporter [Acidimicrobium ferrooxidans]|uniref:LysE family transporter n=1 Tax=Acidimicrobium ferrooxidans TaxID=53635 RepID=A0ABS3AP05_9ACTN|nr:LysE family transporter [Acidimicrobium ferrooxidans]
MEYWQNIGLAFGAFAVGIVSPGPNIMAVIATSLARGRTAGRSVALGIASGSFLWSTLAAVGLSSIIARYAGFVTIMKLVGGIYLAWLAFKAFRSAARPDSPESAAALAHEGESSIVLFRRGLSIQMTNPKAAISWIAIMTLGLSNQAPWWVAAIIVGLLTSLSIVMHLSYAQAFSAARVAAGYRRLRRRFEAATGVFFSYASYKLFTS